MKILFFGSPEFAIYPLKKLLESSHEVLAVYTKVAKESNRGQKLQNTPIYNFAMENSCNVFTPKTLKNSEIQENIASYNADIAVVVAYGLIIPKELFEKTKYGFVNIHPSLLPKWRGASPIQRPILNGDNKTGVSIMCVGEGIDDANIISQQECEITKTTTAEYLHDYLSKLGGDMLLQDLDKIEKRKAIISYEQEHALATYANKIEKSEGRIDWNKTANFIDMQIRALAKFPSVFCFYKGERIRVIKGEEINCNELAKAGEVINESELIIKCGENAIKILILQREGKNEMTAFNFLKGCKILKGEVID